MGAVFNPRDYFSYGDTSWTTALVNEATIRALDDSIEANTRLDADIVLNGRLDRLEDFVVMNTTSLSFTVTTLPTTVYRLGIGAYNLYLPSPPASQTAVLTVYQRIGGGTLTLNKNPVGWTGAAGSAFIDGSPEASASATRVIGNSNTVMQCIWIGDPGLWLCTDITDIRASYNTAALTAGANVAVSTNYSGRTVMPAYISTSAETPIVITLSSTPADGLSVVIYNPSGVSHIVQTTGGPFMHDMLVAPSTTAGVSTVTLVTRSSTIFFSAGSKWWIKSI